MSKKFSIYSFVTASLAAVIVIAVIALISTLEHKYDVQFIGRLDSGSTDEKQMKQTNAYMMAGLNLGFKWVEIRGNKKDGFYVVGHRHGHIPKNYVGNAME